MAPKKGNSKDKGKGKVSTVNDAILLHSVLKTNPKIRVVHVSFLLLEGQTGRLNKSGVEQQIYRGAQGNCGTIGM